MINRDPKGRHSISDYLFQWKRDVIPDVFTHVLYDLNSTFIRSEFLFSDLKIGLIRKYINQIWFFCFNKRNAELTEDFNEPMDPFIAERIKEDTIEKYRRYLVPSNEHFVFMSQGNYEAYISSLQDESKAKQEDRDAIIVVINWLGTFLPTCYFP